MSCTKHIFSDRRWSIGGSRSNTPIPPARRSGARPPEASRRRRERAEEDAAVRWPGGASDLRGSARLILFSTLFYECATAMRPIAGEDGEEAARKGGARWAVAGPWAQPWWARTGRCFIRLVARPPGFGGFYASDPVGPAFLGLGLKSTDVNGTQRPSLARGIRMGWAVPNNVVIFVGGPVVRG